jgi:cytochrome c oxidase subunit III
MGAESLTMPRLPRPAAEAVPLISNTRIAMMVVVAAETMLFAGLIGAYLVFRVSKVEWPPPGQPRLPLGVTLANTVVLFASLVPMSRGLRAGPHRDRQRVVRGVELTGLLGAVFLGIQGLEWVGLVRHGFTLASGAYGATFYVLIGCHGVHVLVATLWLAITAVRARRGFFGPALEMCAIYWYFVCALWAVLFPLVYLY